MVQGLRLSRKHQSDGTLSACDLRQDLCLLYVSWYTILVTQYVKALMNDSSAL